MSLLTVQDFSCLRHVEFEAAPVVAIIGPQGSGKSVTTKLNYFFSEIIDDHIHAAERGENFEGFKRHLGNKFRNWFPPTAWGHRRFNIQFHSGDFYVRILRRLKNNRPTDELAISFSDWFEDFYRQSLSAFRELKERSLDEDLFSGEGGAVGDALEDTWRLRNKLRASIRRRLRDDFVQSQTFIPAGRAFYTSMSKLVAGFDVVGNVDPVTIKFAKFFSEIRERNSRLSPTYRARRFSREYRDTQAEYSSQFFGGDIVYRDENEYVESRDGRRIPFSSLSSGQQELIPIWTVIQYFGELDEIRRSSSSRGAVPARPSQMLYIEEPEAHLFPRSQSDFLSYIFESMQFGRRSRSLILTTHSPYIMGRLNVFLKAGQLSRRRKKNTEINEVVPRERWVNPSEFRAYSMSGGHLTSIIGEDGIIDTEYLDSISEDIVEDFERLLEIEESL